MDCNGEAGGSGRENAPNPNYTSNIEAALREAGVNDEIILELLNLGVSDFCIPMLRNSIPLNLPPGASSRIRKNQQQYLENEFHVNSKELLAHFSLHHDAYNPKSLMPTTLKYLANIGRSNNTVVTQVECPSGAVYALKRIKRLSGGTNEELQQMKYIKGELSILRKIRRVCFRHFVDLVASYTDAEYVGMLFYPVADGNLASYLDNFQPPNRQLLEQFFGCLATALAHLHYVELVRHKDIKPENILVKDDNVLLTDFGISLDWSELGHTTTKEEKMRTPKYCAPEVNEERPRNSQSDIWSLGCVFLEMFAVLKGRDRDDVDSFLSRYGPVKYCTSRQAIQDLIADLRAVGSQHENKPLVWIEKMLQWTKEGRPNARILRKEILEDGYCGICCQDDKIFEDVPPPQEAATIESSIPSQHTMKTYALTTQILLGFPVWKDVEVIRVDSISKCWISRDVLNDSHLDLHDNETAESFTLDGGKFKSEKHAEITCRFNKAKANLVERFLVSTEPMPFLMLVPPSIFDQMRELNNADG